MWRSYAVNAWPTLVVIDRNGYAVGAHAGEFTAEMLEPLLGQLISVSSTGAIRRMPHFEIEKPMISPSFLRYPQKVAVDGARIAISDTGNHRVVVGKLENSGRMTLEYIVTSIEVELDSDLPRTLQSPQGLGFDTDALYVADSENHTIVRIELETGKAHTIAGTGKQMRAHADRDAGALSSPWDLVIVGETIYVAMAGVHQIWAMDKTGSRLRVHCGTGGEDIRDGSLSAALLAQPMGITADDRRLYFADAESSAIRWADLEPRGSVGTIVGTGLFDFGDVDGAGDKVRMQHQQGVARRVNGDLLIADSYNDALKWLKPDAREARTWIRGLHEPGGVAAADRCAYVADTNAHRILVVDYDSDEVRTLVISS